MSKLPKNDSKIRKRNESSTGMRFYLDALKPTCNDD